MKRTALFTLSALLLLYAIRELEYAGLRRNEKGEFAKLRQAFLESHPCDILIIGSSRAECQYYTPLIDSFTKLHSFNIGMTGATPPFIRTSLEAYLENSPAPKYLIYNFDLHSLSDNPDTVHHFPRYFAYLSNEKLREGLQKRDHRFTAFRYFAPYSMGYFNARYLNASIRGWTNKPGKYDNLYREGYTPCEIPKNHLPFDSIKMPDLNMGIPAFVLEELKAIQEICSQNKIQLVLVISPVHHAQRKHVLNYSELESEISSWCVNQHVPLLNLGNNAIGENEKYYADPSHLNENGAMLFTMAFSDSLTQYLPK